ncbi:MAG: hypothetical protein U0703_20285 [Anaerolineae bacterium]
MLAVYDSLSPELIIKPEALEVTPLFAGARTPRSADRRRAVHAVVRARAVARRDCFGGG